MFQHDELQRLADWKPIADGFGRESDVLEAKIEPVLKRIQEIEGTEVTTIKDGGLSNYASAFVFRGKRDGRIEITGHHVYFSLLGPYAAFGRSTVRSTEGTFWIEWVEPEAVLSPPDLQDDFERGLWEIIEAGGFHVLSPQEAMLPLPDDIKPFEYCFNEEPWDRIFHVLFSETD